MSFFVITIGTLIQMINLDKSFNRYRISKIFITHMHIDHIGGLPTLLSITHAIIDGKGWQK